MQTKQYSSRMAFLYFLNNNISGGLLAVPFVFYHAGLLFGLLMLAVVAAITIPPHIWTLETMARAQALEDAKNTKTTSSDRERCVVLDGYVSTGMDSVPPYCIRGERKFEVDELCRIFLGAKTGLLYGWSVVLSCVLSMWYYVTLAASAWAAHVPFDSHHLQQCSAEDFRHLMHPDGGCWNTYTVCILLFGVIVVPFSMMELTEQKVIQVGLSIVRLLAVILMVSHCIVSLVSKQTDEQKNNSELQQDTWLRVDVVGGMSVIPVISHALSFQFLIPSFVQPIVDKRKLHWLLTAAIFACASVYAVLGVTVASYFKDQVVETSTLSWVPLMANGHNSVVRMISYYIVFYPSLAMLSSTPLVAVICSNYIISLCQKSGGDEVRTITKRVIRFCVVMVPLILAIYVSNLVEVLKYGGLAGYASTLIVPGLLVMKSRDVCYQVFSSKQQWNLEDIKGKHSNQVQLDVVVVLDESKRSKEVWKVETRSDVTLTPYTGFLSSRVVVWTILALSVGAIAVTISSIIV